MTSRARSLLLVAIPALALGAAAALVAVVVQSAPDVRPAEEERTAAEDEPEDRTGEDEPVADERPRSGRRGRAGDRPVLRRRLDPAVTAQLSDPDAGVRNAAALKILRMGTGVLDELHYVQAKSSEGAAILSKMEIALDTLRAIERGGDYGQLTPDLVLELRLKYWRTVVPEASLCEERLAHWNARVAGNETRVARGGMTTDEAALDAMDLLLARAECGEIDQETYLHEKAIHLPGARRFVASLAGRSDLGKDKVTEYTDRLAKIERR